MQKKYWPKFYLPDFIPFTPPLHIVFCLCFTFSLGIWKKIGAIISSQQKKTLGMETKVVPHISHIEVTLF